MNARDETEPQSKGQGKDCLKARGKGCLKAEGKAEMKDDLRA